MIRNIFYGLCGGASLLGFLWAAPSGAYLTFPPQRGQVTRDAHGKATIRGTRSTIFWFGGGYHGGK